MLVYYKTYIFLTLTSDSILSIVALVRAILSLAVCCIFPTYINETLASLSSFILQLRWLFKCLGFGRQTYI